MAAPTLSSRSPTMRRILKEAAELSKVPSADYTAIPLESDLFEWHFTLRGPPNSVYADGIYHGRIALPPAYPLRPPSFKFTTPSGRFEVNREICLSISGHHEETWQPAWGIRTALVALRSFMETDPRGQLGGLDATDSVRRRHATASRTYKCPSCGKTNLEIITECEEAAKEAEQASGGASVSEVQVPSELKMGWKDELSKLAGEGTDAAAAEKENGGVRADEDKETAQLAEGFVQTAPQVQPEVGSSQAGRGQGQTASYPAARPAQGVPTPTRTAAFPQTQTQQQNPTAQRVTDEGVPLWVDRAIVVLVIILIAMVLKAVLPA